MHEGGASLHRPTERKGVVQKYFNILQHLMTHQTGIQEHHIGRRKYIFSPKLGPVYTQDKDLKSHSMASFPLIPAD